MKPGNHTWVIPTTIGALLVKGAPHLEEEKMAVSVGAIIAKRQNSKWNNYPKLKEAIAGAFASDIGMCEVTITADWPWRDWIKTKNICVIYSAVSKYKDYRSILVDLN